MQKPLPETAHIPAWVYAALDAHRYDPAIKPGLHGMLSRYPVLANSMTDIEHTVFYRLRDLALAWQRTNFRTFLTELELQVMQIERDVMQLPHSSREAGEGERKVNSAFVIEGIQQHLARKQRYNKTMVIMNKAQIRATLDNIDCILTIAEYTGYPTEGTLQPTLQSVA